MSHGPQRNPSSTYTTTAGQTVFPITFPFLNASDLIVSKAGTVVTTGFTVTGGLGGLGTVTFTVAPTTGNVILIKSIYSADTTNAMIRRWNDLGSPIDGPMARELQMVNGNNLTIGNQSNQKLSVNERTEAQAGGVAQGVYSK